MIPGLLPVFLWHLTSTLQRRARRNLNLSLMSWYKVLEDFVESGGGEKLTSESLQSEVNDVIVVRNNDFWVTSAFTSALCFQVFKAPEASYV